MVDSTFVVINSLASLLSILFSDCVFKSCLYHQGVNSLFVSKFEFCLDVCKKTDNFLYAFYDVSGFVSELNKSLFLIYEVITRHLISQKQIVWLIKCVLSISLKLIFTSRQKGINNFGLTLHKKSSSQMHIVANLHFC